MSLLCFPNELLLCIAHSLRPKALNSLLRSNRRLASLLTPVLHDLSFQGEDGLSALQWAASKGHGVLVTRLLERGVDINEQNKLGQTALHLAAAGGHDAVLKFLVENGANVTILDKARQNAIHHAVQHSYPSSEAMVGLLLESGVDGSAWCDSGCTPLHLAVVSRLEGAARLLLDSRCDVDARGRDLKTPLFYSTSSVALVKILLDYGANINARCHGDTVLHVIARLKDKACMDSEPVIDLLLERGADISHRNYINETPLHVAAMHGHEYMVKILLEMGADHTVRDNSGTYPTDQSGLTPLESVIRYSESCKWGIVKMLLDVRKDAAVTIRRGDGQTLLHLVAYRCNARVAVARLLLEYGADVHARDINGWTALHTAAGFNDSDEMVKLLLEYGADVSAQESGGRTPLHFVWMLSCESGCSSETARILMEHGSNTSIQDINGNTALHEAAQYGPKDVVELLLVHGADVSTKNSSGHIPLHRVAMSEIWSPSGDKALRAEAVATVLLEKGQLSDISLPDVNGLTPLHWAAMNYWNGSYNGWKGLLRIFLQYSPDISIPDYEGTTVLHVASRTGYGPAVSLLLEHGADVSARDKKGWTALHWASDGHFSGPDVVRILLEYGADISAQDNEGVTPLHMRARSGFDREVRLLLERGADVSARNTKEQTPLHWAGMQNRHQYGEVVAALLEGGADIFARDAAGATALHWTAKFGCDRVARDLLKRGADVAAVDSCGLMAIDWAKRLEDSEDHLQVRDRMFEVLGQSESSYGLL